MADEGGLSSAVVVPEAEAASVPTPPPLSRKRRQSSVSESDEHKRARVSVDGDTRRKSESLDPAIRARELAEARSRLKADEQKRSKRVFAGVINSLSRRSGPTAAQKRREAIDRKQEEKLREQQVELGLKQRQRREDLQKIRAQEQPKWNEQAMLLRHSNQLAMARFLRTTAEPVLYYYPQELSSADKLKIEDQIRDATAQIKKELEEFDQQRAADIDGGIDSPIHSPNTHDVEMIDSNMADPVPAADAVSLQNINVTNPATEATELVPASESAGLVDEPVGPVDESVVPVGESVSPIGESAVPVGEPVGPVDESAVPVGESVEPIDESAEPVGESMDVVGESVAPAGEPTGAEEEKDGDEGAEDVMEAGPDTVIY
ncbi:hypothetical protein K402DRAFT_396994 [Aulographum hederae CBS 113979]|uniref:Pinin/SDK/MemA protein domain-containing protein n=1 Tax=Aulographum hederae CBS 113979 TaxID=1176131 RepID=A0A6G1GQI1_9PEZI|nr:hypothetical protein K402DRAFT_396994 [Aulographum hederae CBS 113979]